jgi:hypothetical protein
MQSVFGAIAADLGKPFLNYQIDGFESDKYGNDVRFIMLNYHSKFRAGDEALLSPRNKLLHVYRDPRDVIISAAHYHVKSSEAWLHQRQDKFSGKSYQEKLISLGDVEKMFVFEMENESADVIRDMEIWNYEQENCMDVKYEDLISDSRLHVFTKIFNFLGFEKSEISTCRSAAKKFSLFGKMTKKKNTHIRSGKARQWERHFTPELALEFERRFPTALQTLGYEVDNSWIDRCGTRLESGATSRLFHALDLRKRLPF